MDAESFRINRPDVIDEHFEDEYVLVNLRSGAYYSLNRSAAVIWDMLVQNLPRRAILGQLEQINHADAARISTDVDTLLADLTREQLIIPQASAAAPVAAQPTTSPDGRGEYLAPVMEKFTDMQALLLLDPIHQVDESGWPTTKPDAR